MKFYNAGKSGAIVILDDGEIRVAANMNEIKKMLQRLAPDSTKWTSETLECAKCHAIWCELHPKNADRCACPECNATLALL